MIGFKLGRLLDLNGYILVERIKVSPPGIVEEFVWKHRPRHV